MTTPENLIKYMFLENISSLEFISSRLAKASSKHDIQVIGEFAVAESILKFGYKTKLRYKNVGGAIWQKVSGGKIFSVKTDPLFGQKVSFDIDAYRAAVSNVIKNSEGHKRISKLISEFGSAGFEKALVRVAGEHKWERLPAPELSSNNVSDSTTDISTRSTLSQSEVDEIIADLRKIPVYVDDLALSQSDKAQVLAISSAAVVLAEAPIPPWHTIKELLTLLAAISTTLGFVWLIIEKIG